VIPIRKACWFGRSKFDSSLQEFFISQFIFCNSALFAFTLDLQSAILLMRRRNVHLKSINHISVRRLPEPFAGSDSLWALNYLVS